MALIINPLIGVSFLLMLLGRALAVSSSNLTGVWIGMELNLFSFIALINGVVGNRPTEPIIKYFVVQRVGSMLFIFGGLAVKSSHISLLLLLRAVGVFIKVGLFPFHTWVPGVVGQVRWFIGFLVLTWQKFTPLALISLLRNSPFFFLTIRLMALVGGVGGLNQTTVRGIRAYSSFVHLSWLMVALNTSFQVYMLYFISYSAGLIVLFGACSYRSKATICSFNTSLRVFIGLLMLSGVPPLLGFFGKFLVIVSARNWEVIPCVVSSIISIKYYLSFIYASLLGGNRLHISFTIDKRFLLFYSLMLNFLFLSLTCLLLFV